ncbi:MAG: ferrous iron transport protein B [Planctomycetaceae bacterium]
MPDSAPALNVALIGNPNTGKSTLFNALSGHRALTGNYPGVTVEKKIGRTRCGDRAVNLIDLPGTYSLAPRTPDEMVTVNVLLGRQADVGRIDVVVCILDASNLERNLYLSSQVLDLGLPVVAVLNMADVAQARGIRFDAQALSQRLGLSVVETQAHRKRGIEDVRMAIVAAAHRGGAARPRVFPPPFEEECRRLETRLSELGQTETPQYLLERLLLDVGGYLEGHFANGDMPAVREHLAQARERLARQGCSVPAIEARVRYRWARTVLDGIVHYPATRPVTSSDKLDRILTHKVSGLAVFAALMFLVFQAIYAWAAPLMELCEAGQSWLAEQAATVVPPGPFQSLLVDGVIAGVGAVLVFLPQIVILFLFIALLEDCGYMARAAFLMDKLMTKVGLSGKSFVPLMSSFACAVPGIMATRVIENRRDRMTTILVAPLMSCSARQPVYALMIAAFIPATALLGGWVDLQGVVLFAMTFLGLVVAVPIAWLLKKTVFRGETPPFVMELPSYKWPSPRLVFHRVYDRAKAFVQRAGTLIFATTILVWAAGYFPGGHREADRLQTEIEQSSAEQREALVERQNEIRGRLLEQSLLGRLGHAIEPAVKPMGWDWRIGVGVLASFPAREVIIGTLGTIYSLGGADDPEDAGLQSAVKSAAWPDGRPVYNVPVALSIMVFFALCAQCASTLLVVRRETNSWWWPTFTFMYMTALAYGGAFVAYQVGAMFV